MDGEQCALPLTEDLEQIDIEKLMISINQNLSCAEGSASEDQKQPDSQLAPQINLETEIKLSAQASEKPLENDNDNFKQNAENQLLVVRSGPERAEQIDNSLLLLEKIQNQENILSDQQISKHPVDIQQISQMIEGIHQQYNSSQDKLFKNQETILKMVSIISEKSNYVLSSLKNKDQSYLKLKLSEKESQLKHMNSIDASANKVKYYLHMMLQRLESLESSIDSLISNKVKLEKEAESTSNNKSG